VANPGEEHKPLRVLVLNRLRELIVNGELAPGVRIVEDQIARDLGVSRNPVREALRVLETEGLVEMNPRRGAMVAPLTSEDVAQIFEIREGLEAFVARLAARKATASDGEALYAELSRAEAAIAGHDPAAMTTHNTRFHSCVYAIARNSYLSDVMDLLGGRMERIYRQNAEVRGQGSLEEHAAIARAICGGDEELAASLAAEHVQEAARTYRGAGGTTVARPVRTGDAGAAAQPG
jgi:DNA-binding GntR family transcriptional regulator